MNTDFTLDELKLIRSTAIVNQTGASAATWESITTKVSLAIAAEVCRPATPPPPPRPPRVSDRIGDEGNGK